MPLPVSLEVEAHAFAVAVDDTIRRTIEGLVREVRARSVVTTLDVEGVGEVRVIGVNCRSCRTRHILIMSDVASWEWDEARSRLVRTP